MPDQVKSNKIIDEKKSEEPKFIILSPYQKSELIRLLKKHLDTIHIQVIYEELDIDLGGLQGLERDKQISNLIQFAENKQNIPKLIGCLEDLYPTKDFSEIRKTLGIL